MYPHLRRNCRVKSNHKSWGSWCSTTESKDSVSWPSPKLQKGEKKMQGNSAFNSVANSTPQQSSNWMNTCQFLFKNSSRMRFYEKLSQGMKNGLYWQNCEKINLMFGVLWSKMTQRFVPERFDALPCIFRQTKVTNLKNFDGMKKASYHLIVETKFHSTTIYFVDPPLACFEGKNLIN